MATSLSAKDAERLRNFERSGHDALAANYYEFFSPVTAQAIEPLLQAVGLAPGMRLLDVATGPGAVAGAAARKGAEAIGIDLAPAMVALARRLHPTAEFREADAEHLPFQDRTFDAAVSCFGLGHLPYPEKVVVELLRTLKPGGRIALTWWDDPKRHRIQALFREASAEVGIAPPPGLPRAHSSLRFCDTDEFRRLLDGAGLCEVQFTNCTGSFEVPSIDALWQGGLSGLVLTGSAIRVQNAETQERIRAALERRARVYQSDGVLKIPVAFNIGSGRKPG